MARIELNDDGTVDWVGLTGCDLAALFTACATSIPFLRGGRADRIEQAAYDLVGGSLALWEKNACDDSSP